MSSMPLSAWFEKIFKRSSSTKLKDQALAADIALVQRSGLFDENYYRSQNHDLTGDKVPDAIRHYLQVGATEGRRPSADFDSRWYLSRYPDVRRSGSNPLLHYIKYGRREGRQTTDGATELQSPMGKSDFDLIGASKLFDEDYYLRTYPDAVKRNASPLADFCNFGWKAHRNPNEEFNVSYYLQKNPDVAAARVNPLVHWLQSGRAEGRAINVIEVKNAPVVFQTPTVIFVSHDASPSGAPAVLLSLMRWLKTNTSIQFSIVIGRGGVWNDRFEELAPCFFMDRYHHRQLRDELRSFCGIHVQLVYCNTIVSGLYARELAFLNAKFVVHVHEMESVFRLYEDSFASLATLADDFLVVSEAGLEAVRNRTDGSKRLHLIKPFIAPVGGANASYERPQGKAVVFGCGTVESRKGFDLFCDVAAELVKRGKSDVLFLWIGPEGEMNPSDEITRRGVSSNVRWLGSKPRPADYFNEGDVFLLPSREDPFPLVCLEAADRRLPIVCFGARAGDMPTFVGSDAGVVAPYLDVAALTDAVQSLLDDPSRRLRLGAEAQKRVRSGHYVDIVAPKICALFPPLYASGGGSEVEIWKELIDRSKIISFDIFDTLVTRRLATPESVFDVIEHIHTAYEPGAVALLDERVSTAGKALSLRNGSVDDISIDDIYAEMAFYVQAQFEKDAEIAVSTPHPLGIQIYEYAVSAKKPIYITSDMYLDRQTIETILHSGGFKVWDKMFLSSEFGRKKLTGRLYSALVEAAQDVGVTPAEILHIGDNWEGDVLKAKEAKLKAVRFMPLYEDAGSIVALDDETKRGLSQMGRLWDSFCSQSARLWRLANPAVAADFYTRLGFELTGPLAAIMAMHAKSLADRSGASRIVFLARDGRVIKKAFDTLYAPELRCGLYETRYLHLSRATAILATLSCPLTANDIYFLIEGLALEQKPLSYFLEKAGLDIADVKVRRAARQYFSALDVVPGWDDALSLSRMLSSLSQAIFDANKDRRRALKLYLDQEQVFGGGKLVMVDVGWLLNVQARLAKFARSHNEPLEIVGCYVGSRERASKNVNHSSLLFDRGDPGVYAQFVEKHITLFELLFSAPESAASDLVLNGDGRAEVIFKPLGVPPSHEFGIAQKLQFGAEAFFEFFRQARVDFFPNQISRDYAFALFKALVNTKNEWARACLGNFEIRLGGHHEFVVRQNLLSEASKFEYRIHSSDEYFEPIASRVKGPRPPIVIVTAAGLDNGSTRYRAVNLAKALQFRDTSSVIVHAATAVDKARAIIESAEVVVFQRCFEGQGNVADFLTIARELGKRCVGEIDDLVFPDNINSIGSVAGGEWSRSEAVRIATSYQKLLLKMDHCIASSPAIVSYIHQKLRIPATLIRNKIDPDYIDETAAASANGTRLLYASGTLSHKEDFLFIERILYSTLRRNPLVRLSLLGATSASERLLALDNVASYPLLPYPAMLDFIGRHHVLLVPLENNVFNVAKSNVKFIESGAVGVPVLASRIGEFQTAISHMENGLLASKEEEWADLLDRAALDPSWLRSIGLVAQAVIKDHYTTDVMEPDARRVFGLS